jgi:hypothetical protein
LALHPLHERYTTAGAANSVERLITLLDAMNPPRSRDEAILLAAMLILKPRSRAPTSADEPFGELLEEHVSYNRFKDRMRELARTVPEELLVSGAIYHILAYVSNRAQADPEEIVQTNRKVLERIERENDQAAFETLRTISEQKIENAVAEVAEAQEFYTSFCENVVQGLLEEHEERCRRAVQQVRDVSKRLSEAEEE